MSTVIIGFTRSDRAANYFPMSDGYRLGAAQDEVEIEVDVAGFTVEEVGEFVFIATNAPYDLDPTELPGSIRAALQPSVLAHLDVARTIRSLSVGDTVEVVGVGRWAVARFGWDEIV